MKKNLQIITIMALTIFVAPMLALAEDQRPTQNQGQGQTPPPLGGPDRNGKKPPFEKDAGEKMSKNEKPEQENEQDNEKMKVCQEAFKNAEEEMKNSLTSVQKEQKQTTRDAMKKLRQQKFEIQTKFNKDMFDAETTFMDARALAEDTADKTAIKTAQQTFNKARKDLNDAKNKALKELEKQNKGLNTNSYEKNTGAMKEKIQSLISKLPTECQQEVKPFMPKNDLGTTMGSVKGAFTKAKNKISKKIKK